MNLAVCGVTPQRKEEGGRLLERHKTTHFLSCQSHQESVNRTAALTTWRFLSRLDIFSQHQQQHINNMVSADVSTEASGSAEAPHRTTSSSYESLSNLISEVSAADSDESSSTVATTAVNTANASSAVAVNHKITCGHFLGAVANLCSATLGAGILALPFAIYESGLVFGLILLVTSAWATATSIHLIVQACDYYRLATYESVVEQALGTKWRQVVEISILIFCGGTAVAYVIAVGDIMERIEDVGHFTSHKRLAMTLVWLLAMLPLSCLRKMQSLQCASSVGIMSIGTLLVAATVHLFLPPEDNKPEEFDEFLFVRDLLPQLKLFLWPNHGFLSVLRACPMFFFAYSCQVNVAQIYGELPGSRLLQSSSSVPAGPAVATGAAPGSDDRLNSNRRRVQSMSWVAWVAIVLCSLLYASISFVTLMDFGNAVQPNILSCYHLMGPESALLHLAFLAMALAVIMAFPLNVFPARVSIIQMWEAASSEKPAAEQILLGGGDDEEASRQPLLDKDIISKTYRSSDDLQQHHHDPLHPPPVLMQVSSLGDESLLPVDDDEEPEFHARQHQFVTLLVAGTALGLALVVPNISVVFGLLGGTTSSLLGFVVPGMLGLAMEQDPGNNDISKTSSWVLVVAGTLIGVVTTGVTLYSTFRDSL